LRAITLAPPRVAARAGLLLGKRAGKLGQRAYLFGQSRFLSRPATRRPPTGRGGGAAERSQQWGETQNAPSWNVLSAISLTPASATTPSPSTRAAVATCATTES